MSPWPKPDTFEKWQRFTSVFSTSFLLHFAAPCSNKKQPRSAANRPRRLCLAENTRNAYIVMHLLNVLDMWMFQSGGCKSLFWNSKIAQARCFQGTENYRFPRGLNSNISRISHTIKFPPFPRQPKNPKQTCSLQLAHLSLVLDDHSLCWKAAHKGSPFLDDLEFEVLDRSTDAAWWP